MTQAPEQNQPQDAPGGDGQTPTTPTTSESTPDTQPKVEIKDGVVMVDGKKYVKESDLIAAKGSLQGRLDEAQTAHSAAVDKLKLEVSEAHQAVAQANAALEEARKAGNTGGISEEEVSRIKSEAETAKAAAETANTSLLEMKRKLIMATYNITADSEAGRSLETKDSVQLDSFEEALKALATARGGAGPYALGSGSGSAAPMSDHDRAMKILENTPVRGVRNPSSA